MPATRRDSPVVRGGTARTVDQVTGAISRASDVGGSGPVLSVCTDDPRTGETRDALIERLCRDGGLRHNQVQVAEVGALFDNGLQLERDVSRGQPYCHHHVLFADPVAPSQVEGFIEAFSAPVPNPVPREERDQWP